MGSAYRSGYHAFQLFGTRYHLTSTFSYLCHYIRFLLCATGTSMAFGNCMGKVPHRNKHPHTTICIVHKCTAKICTKILWIWVSSQAQSYQNTKSYICTILFYCFCFFRNTPTEYTISFSFCFSSSYHILSFYLTFQKHIFAKKTCLFS